MGSCVSKPEPPPIYVGVSRMPGVGPVTAKHLANNGHRRPCDVWATMILKREADKLNHPKEFFKWLREINYRMEPVHLYNCLYFLENFTYEMIKDDDICLMLANGIYRDPIIYRWSNPIVIKTMKYLEQFKREDESYVDLSYHSCRYISTAMTFYYYNKRPDLKIEYDNKGLYIKHFIEITRSPGG